MLHFFKPVDKSSALVKRYFSAVESKVCKVSVSQQNVDCDAINGYVTVMYEDNWWLGCVIDKFDEQKEVLIQFLKPHGPSSGIKYPAKENSLKVPYRNVLQAVEATTKYYYS